MFIFRETVLLHALRFYFVFPNFVEVGHWGIKMCKLNLHIGATYLVEFRDSKEILVFQTTTDGVNLGT